jgi:hypothetical protein
MTAPGPPEGATTVCPTLKRWQDMVCIWDGNIHLAMRTPHALPTTQPDMTMPAQQWTCGLLDEFGRLPHRAQRYR